MSTPDPPKLSAKDSSYDYPGAVQDLSPEEQAAYISRQTSWGDEPAVGKLQRQGGMRFGAIVGGVALTALALHAARDHDADGDVDFNDARAAFGACARLSCCVARAVAHACLSHRL